MKTQRLAFTLTLIGCFFFLSNSFSQSKQDSLHIKETLLNYIEGFHTNDATRMEKALHPELAKRSIYSDVEGNNYLYNLSASNLVHVTRTHEKSNLLNPNEEFEAQIIIQDIFKGTASAKLTNNKYAFIDYVHLGKFNGEWKIINVLWTEF